jgi:hypothetical protein
MRRTILTLALVAALAGCGGAATHTRQTLDLPDGARLTTETWVWGTHVLSDPEIGEATYAADGAWTLRGFKSAADNAGLSAVVSGIVQGIARAAGLP